MASLIDSGGISKVIITASALFMTSPARLTVAGRHRHVIVDMPQDRRLARIAHQANAHRCRHPGRCSIQRTSTPSRPSNSTMSRPKPSRPTTPTAETRTPSRASATAWFSAFPPGEVPQNGPRTRRPAGSTGVRTKQSTTYAPTTAKRRSPSGRTRAPVTPHRVGPLLASALVGRDRDRLYTGTHPGPVQRAEQVIDLMADESREAFFKHSDLSLSRRCPGARLRCSAAWAPCRARRRSSGIPRTARRSRPTRRRSSGSAA